MVEGETFNFLECYRNLYLCQEKTDFEFASKTVDYYLVGDNSNPIYSRLKIWEMIDFCLMLRVYLWYWKIQDHFEIFAPECRPP